MMESKETVLKKLNEFLQGQYMGIHSYDYLLERVENEEVRNLFQKFQADHKQHAAMVTERIKSLGGTPVENEGVMGSIQGWLYQYRLPKNTEGLVENAIKGEAYYGVEISEEIVKGDLDPESKALIEKVLDKDREHARIIKELAGKGES